MGFFDRLPETAEPEPERPTRPSLPWMKPEAALPGVVAADVLLVRAPDAAVAISGLRAYPAGFEFTVSAVLRRGYTHGPSLGFEMHNWPRRHRDDALPAEFLRLGVQFSDGRTVTNLGGNPLAPLESEPTGPILMPGGGGGGDRRYDMSYWVWPLPPAGPLTFVCQWPAFAIPESRAEIDGQVVIDAAARAIQLWPENDDGDQGGEIPVASLHLSRPQP